jgi:short-subunit dehydrogenase
MSVLILGATSRIAQQLAHRYAAAGHGVYVAARDEAEAAHIAADLRVRHQVRTAAGPFDAQDFASHGALVEAAEVALGPIEVAVLAFGAMGDQGGSEANFESARQVIEVNYTGAVSVCEAIARGMVERGAGSIIGISSVAGDRGRQSNYMYGSAKGAFTLYLQGLRNRLFKQGVHVMTVKLGFVDTRMTFGMQTGIPIASPEKVAAAIHHGHQRRVDSLYYPRFWKGIMGVIKVIPEQAFKRLNL